MAPSLGALLSLPSAEGASVTAPPARRNNASASADRRGVAPVGPLAPVDITAWNPPAAIIEPNPDLAAAYDELYGLYRGLQPAVSDISHALARLQHHSNNN